MTELKSISELKIDPFFSEVFPIEDDVLKNIADAISRDGYNNEEPITIWKEEGVVIDGHTRIEACINSNRKKIPVTYRSFKSKEAALNYAIKRQMDRRNLSPEQLIAIRQRFGFMTPGGPAAKQTNTTREFAKRTGISERMATDVTLVAKKGSPEQLDNVAKKKKSIFTTANEIRSESKKKENSNKLQKTSKKNYPYARWIWEPAIGAIEAPYNTTPISSNDIRDDLVIVHPDKDILEDGDKIFIDGMLQVINETPQFKYMVHTQTYDRLSEFSWPDNVIIGSKIASQAELTKFVRTMSKKSLVGGSNYIILDPFVEIDIAKAIEQEIIHWVIVGNSNGVDYDWMSLFNFLADCGGIAVYFMPEVLIQPKQIIDLDSEIETPPEEEQAEEEQTEE